MSDKLDANKVRKPHESNRKGGNLGGTIQLPRSEDHSDAVRFQNLICHIAHTANSENGYFGYIPLHTRDRCPSRLHNLQTTTLTSLFRSHSFDKMHVFVFNSGLAAPRCRSADIRYAPILPFPK